MSTHSLAEIYHRYLECLNERRWESLGEFVSDDATRNGKPMGLSGYREMLEADIAALPDLECVAEMVVIQDDLVASRLKFRCTPRRTFLGFEPIGTPISFAEHVFYRFRDKKIAQVWSVIDTEAIAARMAR
ncbi:ester cyclase [Rhodococcus sp. NPDC060086]|uniref:ester cyclase n=1 Tax=Rhodococcus sp. NPDC060086 TaxID=3347055 RepID=UPI003669E664